MRHITNTTHGLARVISRAAIVLGAFACSSPAGTGTNGVSTEENDAAGVYSLVQLNGRSLPAPYATVCEFPGTTLPPRTGDNRALSGTLSMGIENGQKQFTLQVSVEASCAPGHLVTNTPTASGGWEIDSRRSGTVLIRASGSGFFIGPGIRNPAEASLQARTLTVSVYLAGASGASVPATLLFSR